MNEDDYSHRNRRRHRHKRRKLSDGPTESDEIRDRESNLPPDQAFQESLFDALGDDEGAAYWQNVYGQPIHTFPNSFQNPETGELEQMTDDEYASFVRRKMWEKSWEGIEAAREEKRRQREQQRREARQNQSQNNSHSEAPRQHRSRGSDHDFDDQIEASLRRGEHRKLRRRWKTLWQEYVLAWDNLKSSEVRRSSVDHAEQVYLRNKIAWPVESGKREDVTAENVERFISEIAQSLSQDEKTVPVRHSLIKQERIKWHPDKMQQRYGYMDIDNSTMQGITAVFQILDRMWNDIRERG